MAGDAGRGAGGLAGSGLGIVSTGIEGGERAPSPDPSRKREGGERAEAGGVGGGRGYLPAKPYGWWSADTERAFLLALRLTGQTTRAAEEIGRSTSAAYGRRKRDPGFARAWDEAVAAQQAEWLQARRMGLPLAIDDEIGGGRLTPWRERRDGWDAPKRRIFLRTLAYLKDVRAACAAAKISTTAAYRLRAASPPFARAWERALGSAVRSIEQAAYERAVNGWEEVVTRDGAEVRRVRRYSEAVLLELLRGNRAREAEARAPKPAKERPGRALKPRDLVRAAREAARAAGGYFEKSATKDETVAAIMEKLDAVERRMAAEKAEEEAAEWVRWQDCWQTLGSVAPLRVSEGPAGRGMLTRL